MELDEKKLDELIEKIIKEWQPVIEKIVDRAANSIVEAIFSSVEK